MYETSSTRNAMVALALSDRRTHVCHRRPSGHRLFVVSVHRAQLPLLRPFHAPTHAANAAVKSPLAHGGASPATRTDSPPDRPSARRARPAWPSSAFSRDCLYTGEQCSAGAGRRINLGGIRRKDGRGSVLTRRRQLLLQ